MIVRGQLMKKKLLLIPIFALLLTACNETKQEEIKSSNNDAEASSQEVISSNKEKQPDFNVVFDTSDDYQGMFDTQTETQKGYMRDEYTNIDQYGRGSSENSKPNKMDIHFSITQCDVELTGLKIDLYELKDDERVDTIIYLVDKDTTTISLNNLKVDTYYDWTVTAISGDKSVVSEANRFHTVDGTVRFIDIDGLSNVRDCGGWTGLDGKRIKQGLLYRGEEFNKQNNGRAGSSASDYHYDPSKADANNPYGQKITEKGIDTVINELKIKTEVDIRGYETFDWENRINYSPAECGGLVGELPDGRKDPDQGVIGIIDDVNYVICPVHTNRDKLYYDSYGREACKNFFSMLADEENHLPMYFHCAQGKDRTGFLATLFQALLGVSKEDILRDYLLSNLGKTGSVSISKITSNYNYVDYFLEGKEVSTQSGVKYQAQGDTIAERAYNYLLSCGLTETQLDTIRDIFLA